MSRDEMLDIVDKDDKALFSVTKEECYARRLCKRVVNIAVIDPQTRKIALQTRGANLSWQPGFYCISVCGHVRAKETWEAAARRELKEEMGIDAVVNFVDKIYFIDDTDHPFMLGIYTVEAPHHTLIANPDEVGEIMSLSKAEARTLLKRGEKLNNLLQPVLEKVLEKAA